MPRMVNPRHEIYHPTRGDGILPAVTSRCVTNAESKGGGGWVYTVSSISLFLSNLSLLFHHHLTFLTILRRSCFGAGECHIFVKLITTFAYLSQKFRLISWRWQGPFSQKFWLVSRMPRMVKVSYWGLNTSVVVKYIWNKLCSNPELLGNLAKVKGPRERHLK